MKRILIIGSSGAGKSPFAGRLGEKTDTLETRIKRGDTIIFLDFPRFICLRRVIKRFLTYRNNTRPDMTTGCEEKLDREFIKRVRDYPTRTKPEVKSMRKRSENKKTVIRLQSKKEVERFLQNV